jgi:hypothetical protein
MAAARSARAAVDVDCGVYRFAASVGERLREGHESRWSAIGSTSACRVSSLFDCV